MIKTAVFSQDNIHILTKTAAKKVEKSYTGMIIRCSECKEYAHVIDAFFPYFLEGNLCIRHYNLRNEYLKEIK